MSEVIGHSKPTIGKQDVDAVRRVLESGWLSQGEEVRSFEEDLASKIGVADGVCVSSGTAALHLALLAVGVREGDRVAIPGYCCSSVFHAVQLAGGSSMLVDIDPARMVMDEESVLGAVKKGARAVVLVHLLGYPGPVDMIDELGVPVIEDCAQSLGASVAGRSVGSFGTASVFSFFATKQITTGEGGMVASDDVRVLAKVESLRSSRDTGRELTCHYTMSDIQAALGRSQLARFDVFHERRRKTAAYYVRRLSGCDVGFIEEEDGNIPAYFRFVVELMRNDPGETIEAMESAGIQCRRPFEEPVSRILGKMESDLPGCREAFERLLSLPIYPSLTKEDVLRIAEELRRHVSGITV